MFKTIQKKSRITKLKKHSLLYQYRFKFFENFNEFFLFINKNV